MLLLALIGEAKGLICFINDRLDQMKLSENTASRIKESLEYLQSTIRKIEPYLKKDSATKEIEYFLAHLKAACESCSAIENKHTAMKFCKASDYSNSLQTLEAEITHAQSKLSLFIQASHLEAHCEFAIDHTERLDSIRAMNSGVGLSTIVESIEPPPAPSNFRIQDCKTKFKLSWKPLSEGDVDEYEICYNQHDKSSRVISGENHTVEIESPLVKFGCLYAMKVRGINKGGKGKWSKTKYGQLTKPLPQKPKILDIFPRSTTAVITVQIPRATCGTESPVTHVKISCICTTKSKQKQGSHKFKIDPAAGTGDGDVYVKTMRKLRPGSRYNFTVKSKNAEGWSELSDFKVAHTNSLPPKPTKPDRPVIEACTPTKVNLTVQVPQNTCSIKSPINAWKLSGYTADREEFTKYYPIDENDFIKQSIVLSVDDINPEKQYTLRLLARNENGWSEPSDTFKIEIAVPSPPKNVRVSSKRSHSLIKIRWNAPDSFVITHYEIARRTDKDDYNDLNIVKAPADKFSATFTKLRHNTFYYFKIRSCNELRVGAWSEEIKTNTRIHKGIKAVISPAVWLLGTVTSPIAFAIVLGMTVANKPTSSKATVAAATAAGAVAGTLGSPVIVGTFCAHAFVHGIDTLSVQSDDENPVEIAEC